MVVVLLLGSLPSLRTISLAEEIRRREGGRETRESYRVEERKEEEDLWIAPFIIIRYEDYIE